MNNYNRDQVMNVISSVMGKINSSQGEPLEHIRSELSGLAKTIDDMHKDILSSRGHDISDKHVPTATDELDAVVGATEEATASIMDSCDAIQAIVENVEKDTRASVFDETTKIFEACSFQDITGQRIAKVIKTLKDIELTVDNLLNLFGPEEGDISKPEAIDNRTEDEKLLNGPQLNGQGVSQDDIDKLLAEFD